MTSARVQALAARLPKGLNEIYFHPATSRGAQISRLMPGYQHRAEFEALCDPDLRAALDRSGTRLSNWATETAGREQPPARIGGAGGW